MYCKSCGFELNDKAVMCVKCGRNPHEEDLKTRTVKKIKALQKQAEFIKRKQKMIKAIMIASACVAVLFFVLLVGREEPTNIPEPYVTVWDEGAFSSNYSVTVPSDYMYYADANVQEYWQQGRMFIGYILMSLFVTVVTFIYSILQKKRYKNIIGQIKEELNVLQSMRK